MGAESIGGLRTLTSSAGASAGTSSRTITAPATARYAYAVLSGTAAKLGKVASKDKRVDSIPMPTFAPDWWEYISHRELR